MIRPNILFRYVFMRVARTIAGFFVMVLSLIVLVDFVENLRRAAGRENAGAVEALQASLLHAPSIAEEVFPFAILIGSMIAFLDLSRKLELVVARASGVSIWQILAPAIAFAVLCGIFVATLYNPVAATMRAEHDRMRIEYFGGSATGLLQGGRGKPWLRQQGVDGQAIIHAAQAAQNGTLLSDVIVFVFAGEDDFVERIDATRAELLPGRWILNDARVTKRDGITTDYPTYVLSTHLTPEKVREVFGSLDAASFWELRGLVDAAELAGLPTRHYQLEYHSLLALPAFFAAMVFVAATVSLRIFRFGNLLRMIVIGIATGFVLYVLVSITRELGSNGTISAMAAVWLPVILAMMFSVSVLLHQEDG